MSSELIPSGSSLPSTTGAKSKYSFWKSPGGKFGTVSSWALLAGLGWGAWKIMPYVVELLQNTILATVLGVIAFGLVYMIMDKQVHTIVWNLYKMIVNRIATTLIEYDPVSIANNYITYLEGRLAVMVGRVQELKGAIRKIDAAIEKAERERTESLDIFKRGRESDEIEHRTAAALAGRKAGRRMQSIEDFKKIKEKLEFLYRVLMKMKMAAEFTIEDKKDEVLTATRMREGVSAGYSAYQAAVEIIRGDVDKRTMFDRSMQFMLDDMAAKVGEIDSFLDMSEGILGAIDLQNMAYDESAMRQLEAWEAKLDDTLLLPGADKQILLEASHDSGQPLNIDGDELEAVPARARKSRPAKLSEFDEFFDSKS